MSDSFSCECCGRTSPASSGYSTPHGHYCEECFDQREDGPGVHGVGAAAEHAERVWRGLSENDRVIVRENEAVTVERVGTRAEAVTMNRLVRLGLFLPAAYGFTMRTWQRSALGNDVAAHGRKAGAK